MLEIKNLSKNYVSKNKEVTNALVNFNYNFPYKGLFCILGESGCGKTTLLNLIGGIDKSDEGDIIINGLDIKDLKEKELDNYRSQKIGFIFQDNNLLDNLTLYDNVSLSLALNSIKGKERTKLVDEYLDKVGLKDKKRKLAKELSGGEKQRATIARALIKNPSILLADEPTGSLDEENSLQVMNILKELSKRILVILVSHDKELVNKFADSILYMKKGKLIGTKTINHISGENEKVSSKQNKRKYFSFIDAIKLSFTNILSKKLSTILVAFTLGLGIAGLGLVLAIKSGFSNYLDNVEQETLVRYPVTIEKSGLATDDLFSILNEDKGTFPDDELIHGVERANEYLVQNNFSDEFMNYLSNIDEKYKNSIRVNESYSMNILYKNAVNNEVEVYKTSGNSYLSSLANSSLWNTLPSNSDNILEDYDVISGKYPENKNEGILIVDTNNNVPIDLLELLGSADLLNENNTLSFDDIFNKTFKLIDYNDLYEKQFLSLSESQVNAIFLKRGYELYNDGLEFSDLYGYINLLANINNFNENMNQEESNHLKEELEELLNFISLPKDTSINIDEVDFTNDDEIFNFLTSLVTRRYLDVYKEKSSTELLEYFNDEAQGCEIKIVGILRPKKELAVPTFNTGLYISSKLEEDYKARNFPEFVDENNNGIIEEKEDHRSSIAKSYESNLFIRFDGTFNVCTRNILNDNEESNDILSYIENRQLYGLDHSVQSITIYPRNFEEKSAILNYIDKYNANKEKENQITYTDLTSIVLDNVKTLMDLISFVLVILSAVSLVVGLLLEALVTSLSLREKRRDIGILRSLGARTKDVINIFLFESGITGIASAIFGLLLVLISGLVINLNISCMFGLSSTPIVNFSAGLILLILFVAIVINLVASFIPIIVNAKKKPVEVIHSN